MSRRKRRKKVSEQSMIGAIIDLPVEEFKKQLETQKVSIGVCNNTILNLTSAYHDLKARKEAVLDLVFKGTRKKDDPEIQKALNGLYAEMTKTEQKIEILRERVKDLIDVDKTPN